MQRSTGVAWSRQREEVPLRIGHANPHRVLRRPVIITARGGHGRPILTGPEFPAMADPDTALIGHYHRRKRRQQPLERYQPIDERLATAVPRRPRFSIAVHVLERHCFVEAEFSDPRALER